MNDKDLWRRGRIEAGYDAFSKLAQSYGVDTPYGQDFMRLADSAEDSLQTQDSELLQNAHVGLHREFCDLVIEDLICALDIVNTFELEIDSPRAYTHHMAATRRIRSIRSWLSQTNDFLGAQPRKTFASELRNLDYRLDSICQAQGNADYHNI